MDDVQAQINDLQDKMRRLESTLSNIPAFQLPALGTDSRVPYASGPQLVSANATNGSTAVALTWINPDPANVDHFEVWVKRASYQSENPYLAVSCKDSPATFAVTADQDTIVVAFIRTVLKNGLGSDLASSPTVTFNVYMHVQIPDGTITTQMIQDAAITNAKIGTAAVGTANIQNAAITNALIANLAVNNAKINDLAANKITAGTFVAGVIYAGQIDTPQINAGTINVALTLNAATINTGIFNCTDGGNNSVTIDSGNIIKVSGGSNTNQMLYDRLKLLRTGGGDHYETDLLYNGYTETNTTSGAFVQVSDIQIQISDGSVTNSSINKNSISTTTGTATALLDLGGIASGGRLRLISTAGVDGFVVDADSGGYTAATAGTHGAPPSQVQGYLLVKIGGTDRKIPYYNT